MEDDILAGIRPGGYVGRREDLLEWKHKKCAKKLSDHTYKENKRTYTSIVFKFKNCFSKHFAYNAVVFISSSFIS